MGFVFLSYVIYKQYLQTEKYTASQKACEFRSCFICCFKRADVRSIYRSVHLHLPLFGRSHRLWLISKGSVGVDVYHGVHKHESWLLLGC